MSNVLIDRLTNIFGAPDRVENVEAFVIELGKLTAGFGVDVLDRAASDLIRNGGRSWPAPKAIVQACVDAQSVVAFKTNTSSQPRAKTLWELDAERAEAWAKDFCRLTEISQRAFREGWGRQVYLWAQAYARECHRQNLTPQLDALPTVAEVENWVRYCRSPSKAMAHRSVPNPVDFTEVERSACLGEPLSGASASMNRRLAELASKVGRPIPEEEQEPPNDLPPIGAQPQRIKEEKPRLMPSDRHAWEAKFGKPTT